MKKTVESDHDSTVDSDNSRIYQRNLYLLKTTPKKSFNKLEVLPRAKQIARKCTLKRHAAQSFADEEEQVINPYSTDDDKSIKLENLEEDTDESFSDEVKARIKRSKNYRKLTLPLP